ncbi:MAG: hypothetical protein KKA90_01695 [Nanoarchaeota archaeon]|nr:hypothetical protein [Nanoarchaeota archaeon]
MKGQAYSLMALVIAIPLFSLFAFSLTTFQEQHSAVAEMVVIDQMRIVEKTIEADFQKGVTTSAKRAFIAITDHVVTNGEFMDNTGYRGVELILNGTLYGVPNTLMQNNTLTDWKMKIQNITTGFETSISFLTPQLDNISGMTISGTYDILVNISDPFGRAIFEKRTKTPLFFTVEGFDDPLYIAKTSGIIKRTYNLSLYSYYAKKLLTGSASSGNCSGLVTFDEGDTGEGKILVTTDPTGITGFTGIIGEGAGTPSVSCFVVGAAGAIAAITQTLNDEPYPFITLDNFTNGVWHIPLNDTVLTKRYQVGVGASVYERLQGNFTGNNYSMLDALDSFVYIPELEDAGLPVKENQSIVDFYYFQSQEAKGYHVRHLPDWVKINTRFAEYYNFSDLLENAQAVEEETVDLFG